jgi:hypothetical protein
MKLLGAALTLAILLPFVFLPLLLLFSRPGDGRNRRRAFLGAATLLYGFFMLTWAPLTFAFASLFAWAWRGEAPDRQAVVSFFSDGLAQGTVGLGALFVVAGLGVLFEKRWGYIAALCCLIAFALLGVFSRT